MQALKSFSGCFYVELKTTCTLIYLEGLFSTTCISSNVRTYLKIACWKKVSSKGTKNIVFLFRSRIKWALFYAATKVFWLIGCIYILGWDIIDDWCMMLSSPTHYFFNWFWFGIYFIFCQLENILICVPIQRAHFTQTDKFRFSVCP